MKNSLEVPTYNNMMCELFQAMKELGGSGTIREIDDKTIEILGVPIEVQEIMHGSSSKTEIEYRLAWTRTYMKKVGILENSSLLWDEPYKRALLHVGKNEDGVDLRARLRRSPQICRILVRYHFGLRERQEGEKSVRFVATPEFAAVLEKLQVRMMEKIMAKGIAVECNPSSNHLIGTFDR